MAVTISRIDLEALIGPEAAAWLVSQFGGQSIYIPKRAGAGRAIEAVVGAVAFEVLQAEYGGLNVNLPGKPRQTLKDQIIPMIEAGMSHNEIAAKLGCTSRHVAGIKSNMGLTKPSAAQKARREAERNA
ncbi:MAG: hypothetical protein EOM37_12980 [Proteobacteria bacterium]|nr:hypothetical protein [Pseudomonadota bacterium]